MATTPVSSSAGVNGGSWTLNPRVPETIDIDQEQVQWDQLEDKFLGREIAIRGSSGCPLRCKFCSFVVLHPEFDLKSVEVLRDELRRVKRRSDIVKHVSFTDDNLFLKRGAVDSYCKMMVDEDLPFTWSAFMRVDSITPSDGSATRPAPTTAINYPRADRKLFAKSTPVALGERSAIFKSVSAGVSF